MNKWKRSMLNMVKKYKKKSLKIKRKELLLISEHFLNTFIFYSFYILKSSIIHALICMSSIIKN